MSDLQNRADIEKLLWAFYTRMLADPSINYIFTDVAKINLEEHMPSLTDFWEQTLFYTGGYRKNVMQIHLDLNAEEPLTQEYFTTWLRHFNETADSLFSGENTEKAKTRALSVATIMQVKMHNK